MYCVGAWMSSELVPIIAKAQASPNSEEAITAAVRNLPTEGSLECFAFVELKLRRMTNTSTTRYDIHVKM